MKSHFNKLRTMIRNNIILQRLDLTSNLLNNSETWRINNHVVQWCLTFELIMISNEWFFIINVVLHICLWSLFHLLGACSCNQSNKDLNQFICIWYLYFTIPLLLKGFPLKSSFASNRDNSKILNGTLTLYSLGKSSLYALSLMHFLIRNGPSRLGNTFEHLCAANLFSHMHSNSRP